MKNFILATRPKTLLAGVIPPLVSYAYFFSTTKTHEPLYLALCIFGALFIQLATNFFNDVIDFKKGADASRVGPTRVSAAGLVSVEKVEQWAYLSIALAALCGVPLILRGGWPFLVLGLTSLYLTYGYTGGKISLAYRGLGELFVFLFFGLFSVMGSFYLFALKIDLSILIIAIIYGLLTTTFIAVNNLRDRETDSRVGKNTLAVSLGEKYYKLFTLLTIFLPYALSVFFINYLLLPLITFALIPALKLSSIILTKKGAELNDGLKFSGIHLILFSLFLGSAFIYAGLL
jgi:1,4-dihydroxy-2-naphthoate octaprenyltransferase